MKKYGFLTKSEMLKYVDNWKTFPLENYPGYEQGKPPVYSEVHEIEWIEEAAKTWDRKFGSQGIGKLREVAVCRPCEDETLPLFQKDPRFFLYYHGIPNLKKRQEEFDAYIDAMKNEGVKIHYFKYPSPALGPYGPIRWLSFMRETLITRGGAIISRFGMPWNKGRDMYLQKFLVEELGIPVLMQIHGKGVGEIGAQVFLAENVWMVGLGIAFNQEALNQVTPVLQSVGVKEIFVTHIPGPLDSIEWPLGGTYHPDMFIGIVDVGIAVIYPAWCDYETIKWLTKKGFKLIEVPAEEQRKYLPVNLQLIEPGKVIMPEGANETIKKVRAEGVDVIEVPFSEQYKESGGMRCTAMQILREPGPGLEEIKR